MRTALFSRLSLLLSMGALSVGAFAQSDTPPTVKVTVNPASIQASKPFEAVLSVTFADGLHAYQNPPSADTFIPVVVKVDGTTFSVVNVKYPKGTPTKVAGEDKPVNVYTGTIKITVTLKAPAKIGSYDLKLAVNYQQCNEGSCYPPSSVDTKVTIKVAKATAKPVKKLVKGKSAGR